MTYQKRRDVLVKGLHEAGWMVDMPKASMYVWAKIPEAYATLGSLEFTKKLLAQAKVSVSPGIGFGEFGDGHVRFAMIENESADATGHTRHQADVPRRRTALMAAGADAGDARGIARHGHGRPRHLGRA